MSRKERAEQVAEIQRSFPQWEAWVVDRVYGGPVWCARRRDNHRIAVHGGNQQELLIEIAERVISDV